MDSGNVKNTVEHKISSIQSKISEIDAAIQKVRDPEFIQLSGVDEFFANIKEIVPVPEVPMG